MLSQEEVSQRRAKPIRKTQRACDYCRHKKIRCNGAEMPDNRCSRCIKLGRSCTYEPTKTLVSRRSYIQFLENRLQNMETLFAQLHPDVEIPEDFDSIQEIRQLLESSNNPQTSSSNSDELESSEDEVEVKRAVEEKLRHKIVHADIDTLRYYGKSSNLLLLQAIIDLKGGCAGTGRPRSAEPAIRDTLLKPEYRYHSDWLRSGAEEKRSSNQHFPEPYLMDMLVDAYFKHINVYLPLLHRPTFEKDLKDNWHLQDQTFGGVVLLVCAIGSRWTDDPRVSADEKIPGWRWFEKVESARWSFLERPQVGHLQACALSSMYLGSTPHGRQGGWTVIGLGLRMAQHVGAHRKKMYSTKPTVEEELWKRAFWVLVALDRVVSFGLGRPCAIHDEDFDIDPMLECDDEYWDNPDPDQAFKQPEGRPSTIAFANCLLHLWKILAFASRTIYSINKMKLTLGFFGPQWEQKIVAELESALNKWMDAVPVHLKWDPSREDGVFMEQSATLYAQYYFLQICVHRPFIVSNCNVSRLPSPSLTICTNAAHSCMHVLDIQFQLKQTPLPMSRLPLFTAGLVLILNIWGGKRSGLSNQESLNDVHKCMNLLKRLQHHTYSARRPWDILNSFLSIGELPPPDTSPFASTERPAFWSVVEAMLASAEPQSRELLSTGSLAEANTHNQTAATDSAMKAIFPSYTPDTGPRTVPRLPTQGQTYAPFGDSEADGMSEMGGMRGMSDVPGDVQMDAALPVHTGDLGRLPFYHGFVPPQGSVSAPVPSFSPASTVAPQRPQMYFAGLALQPQDALGSAPSSTGRLVDASVGGRIFDHRGGFPMNLTDYSDPLAVLSVPITSADTPGTSSMQTTQTWQAQDNLQACNTDCRGEMAIDVSMMSAENLAFTDNMLEVWSTAPTSFEWDAWGAYLTNMSGMSAPFYQPPPSAESGF